MKFSFYKDFYWRHLQQIIEANRRTSPNAAFGIYAVVFVLYFAACRPVSLLAEMLEEKWKDA